MEQFGGGAVSYINVIKLRIISLKIPLAIFYSGQASSALSQADGQITVKCKQFLKSSQLGEGHLQPVLNSTQLRGIFTAEYTEN